MVTVEILVMKVLTMPLHLAHWTSSHNVATRWIHHNFDAPVCFHGCHNITEILERRQRIRTDAVSLSPYKISIMFTIRFIVLVVHLTCLLVVLCFLALSLFPFWILVSSNK